MESLNICVAGKTIKIISDKKNIRLLSANMAQFVTSKKSVFSLTIIAEKAVLVSYVRKNGQDLEVSVPEELRTKNGVITIDNPFLHQEIWDKMSVAVLKSDSYILMRNAVRNCFLVWFKELVPLHGAGIIHDGKGYLFCGPPGEGKSTIARSAPCVLNDEFVFVRQEKKSLFMYGTPFGGELEPQNRKVLLEKVFFIRQSKRNSARKLSPAEKHVRFMESDHLFFKVVCADEPRIAKLVFRRAKLMGVIAAFELRFTLKCDFWRKIM